MTHICVTRPQWVKLITDIHISPSQQAMSCLLGGIWRKLTSHDGGALCYKVCDHLAPFFCRHYDNIKMHKVRRRCWCQPWLPCRTKTHTWRTVWVPRRASNLICSRPLERPSDKLRYSKVSVRWSDLFFKYWTPVVMSKQVLKSVLAFSLSLFKLEHSDMH